MQDVEEGYLTQKAGEPSQGDWRKDGAREIVFTAPNFVDNATRRYNDATQTNDQVPEHKFPAREDNFGPRNPDFFTKSPDAKSPMFKTNELSRSAEQDVSRVNTSYSISDWAAVGVTASVLADWSDSQSTSSYASYGDSISSMEATIRPSALNTPLANEIDQLVAKLDFDGVKLAAEKFETSMDDEHHRTIEEKRRKKRELEDWRASISKTFSKSSGT
jgi:hypothetical protein